MADAIADAQKQGTKTARAKSTGAAASTPGSIARSSRRTALEPGPNGADAHLSRQGGSSVGSMRTPVERPTRVRRATRAPARREDETARPVRQDAGRIRRLPTMPTNRVQRETQTFTDEDGNVTQNPDISSTQELLADAARVEGKFGELLTEIATFTKADVQEHKVTKKAKVKDAQGNEVIDPTTGKAKNKKTQSGKQIFTEQNEVLTGAADLKGAKRIKQKLKQKYDRKHERIIDVVRGTLAYADSGQLAKALVQLKDFTSGRDDLKIVRCKQLFRVKGKKSKAARKKKGGKQSELDKKLAAANVGPSAAVYGDVKVSLSIDDHVCELQFNLVPMLKAKSTKAGHGAYEAMRTLETEWVKAHKGAKEMPDIDALHQMANDDHPDVKKIKGALQKAINASQAAYGAAHNEIKKQKDYDLMIKTAESLAG